MRSSYQDLPALRTLAPILELSDLPYASGGQSRASLPLWMAPAESPISSPVLVWDDDSQASPSCQTKEGSSLSPACPQLLSPNQGVHHGSETAKVALVWRSIGNVVSQMKAMQQQISVSAAILKVMSAISAEASDVQDAKRRIKERSGLVAKAEIGGSATRVQLDERLSCLREQVASLQDLLASERPPSEQEVLEVLSKLKVSRIKTIATAALSFKRLKPATDKDTKSLTFRSALGLPSLQLRKRDVKVAGEDKGPSVDLGMDTPSSVSPAILEEIQARALQYSSSFSSFGLNRHASLPRQSGQAAPMGIPSLPKQRKSKSRSSAVGSREGNSEDYPTRVTAEVQEQVLARALQYSDSFSAIALRHASRQASFLQQPTGPPPVVPATTPVGIPSLPKRRKMKSRRRAQAQVDEAAWKASCGALA